ncbi:MAG TPA: glycoside hydrolase family 15 protein [Actinomycetota bacterium]|nr:glycoside hydrolase family 15 protein [Actinomycetota bacterium]
MVDTRAASERSDPGADDRYPPIRDLAAIGDGRTIALVSLDGTVCWLPIPSLDSATVFASLLDAERGGGFTLAPTGPFDVRRRYLPDTNVLETTFTTPTGTAAVIDGMTLQLGRRLAPFRELVRLIEGVDGSVEFSWSCKPRFGYGEDTTRVSRRAGVPVFSSGNDAMAISTWDAGEPQIDGDAVGGSFTVAAASSAMLCLGVAHQEPLVLPSRRDVEGRLERTIAYWRDWAEGRPAQGAYREDIIRSALALKLLVHAPTGAVAAAATTSLPEEIGGERNWDYRFSWVRDSAFVMEALLGLGCREEAEAFFWWLMHASQNTRPRLQVLYRLDGGARAKERTLRLDGYSGSRPVRLGNKAIEQRQLDIYGDLMQTAWLYADAGYKVDREIADRLAAIADLVCEIWSEPDAGIWEVRSEFEHFTQSKMLCWVALDRAMRLAADGHIPSNHVERWAAAASDVRAFVEERCWSAKKRSYTRAAGSEELDASVLLGARLGYIAPDDQRLARTIDALGRELADAPFLYRYLGEDGLRGGEGAFLCCSFWLVEALAKARRLDEATVLMDELLRLSNDVGLYSEEIDPVSGAFLGNFPQGLTHLALLTAAAAIRAGGAAR